ncbi:Putative tetraacyldisaccharide 4\'-kinase [gamma proteobacterium HdN1]|nr:Putative tetraacyldisaccharide 4\'-kinase [gamma proteobacterium HdN1]
MSALERYFNRLWYEDHWQKWLFWPASQLAERVVNHRRNKAQVSAQKYHEDLENGSENSHAQRNPPVIVIGNLTVGGTGKTPLILFLVNALQARGLHVGVISRGFGGKASYPLSVTRETPASLSGDEPALIVRRTGVRMVVDPDRARAAKYLIAQSVAADAPLDLILSDDGMQHYGLQREIEILVVDGARGFGNQRMLPMGPLREPLDRLESLRFAVINGSPSPALLKILAEKPRLSVYPMQIQPGKFRRLGSSETAAPEYFQGREYCQGRELCALAGIGNPERFFKTLGDLGIHAKKQIFSDHHHYCEADLLPFRNDTIIMTEKDAVKIQPSWLNDAWYLSVDAEVTEALVSDILSVLP